MIHLGMTNSEYHARSEISKSGLDRIDQSPAHYRVYLTEPKTDTPALITGTATHDFVLEHDTFFDRYIVAPEGMDRRTKDGKAMYERLQASGKTIITSDMIMAIDGMNESIKSHPAARELLQEGQAEVSAFGELDGVPVRCRPDWLRQDGIIVDLKTTENASPAAFSKSVANYRYHVQAAFYQDILATLDISVSVFVFIVVEKTAPFGVGVYELDLDSLDAGRDAYRRNLHTYKTCLETDQWPAYSQNVEVLSLPRWAFAQAA